MWTNPRLALIAVMALARAYGGIQCTCTPARLPCLPAPAACPLTPVEVQSCGTCCIDRKLQYVAMQLTARKGKRVSQRHWCATTRPVSTFDGRLPDVLAPTRGYSFNSSERNLFWMTIIMEGKRKREAERRHEWSERMQVNDVGCTPLLGTLGSSVLVMMMSEGVS
eukprot:SAG11_NODE_5463_length_1552_cov_1.240881_3_plen_166_part_00